MICDIYDVQYIYIYIESIYIYCFPAYLSKNRELCGPFVVITQLEIKIQTTLLVHTWEFPQHPNTLQEFQDAGCLPQASLEDAFGHVSGESDQVPIQTGENENSLVNQLDDAAINEVPIQNGESDGSLVNQLDDAGIKTPMESVTPSDSSTRVDSSVPECPKSVSAMFVNFIESYICHLFDASCSISKGVISKQNKTKPGDSPSGSAGQPVETQSVRRRSKGPELTRPMLTSPLEPPSEPVGIGSATDSRVANPLAQLKLVAIW